MRSGLDSSAINIPKGAIHVDHRNDVVVGRRVPQKEAFQERAKAKQKANRHQEAADAYYYNGRLQVRELKVLSRDTVIPHLKMDEITLDRSLFEQTAALMKFLGHVTFTIRNRRARSDNSIFNNCISEMSKFIHKRSCNRDKFP